MVVYILILALLFVKFWDIIPIGYISEDIQLVSTLIYLILGCIVFRKRKKLSFPLQYKYLIWIFVGLLLSMFSAYIFFNQSLIQSIITYRVHIYLLAIVVFFRISPKLEEIVQALFYFALLMLLVEILMPLFPYLFVLSEKKLEYAYAVGDMGVLKSVAGIGYLTIPMFYYLQRIKEHFSFDALFRIVVLFCVFVLAENRSNLFPVMLFMFYTLFQIRSKYKPFILCGLLLLGAIFVVSQKELFIGLYEESVMQINDSDYNRNKAYSYYLFEACPNILCYILGNGRISLHLNPMTANLMEQGIFNTDVGFIGYWNEFGVIPIISMFVMFCNVLRLNRMPYFMKLLVLHILLGGLTVSYFGSDVKIFQFVIFYYLYFYCLSYPNVRNELVVTGCKNRFTRLSY